jgi:hypothetical protein
MTKIQLRCPVCSKFTEVEVERPDLYTNSELPRACDTCAEKRRNEIAAKAALQPPTDHLLGSTATLPELPVERTQRPGGSGRRIFKNEKSQQ